jgi:hypothetical protein
MLALVVMCVRIEKVCRKSLPISMGLKAICHNVVASESRPNSPSEMPITATLLVLLCCARLETGVPCWLADSLPRFTFKLGPSGNAAIGSGDGKSLL